VESLFCVFWDEYVISFDNRIITVTFNTDMLMGEVQLGFQSKKYNLVPKVTKKKVL
jgi:hypothetical protein